mmetsp:Transcript_6862/g.12307  ORF Transcript_6862/g.12307 Transcript_6862/m.12307 type:complete len:86 (-) Transcript_6862:794-1051(-)
MDKAQHNNCIHLRSYSQDAAVFFLPRTRLIEGQRRSNNAPPLLRPPANAPSWDECAVVVVHERHLPFPPSSRPAALSRHVTQDAS